MFKPSDAQNFYKLSKWQKIKTIIKLMKKFDLIDSKFKDKKYILITAATVPFKRIMGEVSPAINAMSKYIKKLKGKVIKKSIYTDILFRFKPKK